MHPRTLAIAALAASMATAAAPVAAQRSRDAEERAERARERAERLREQVQRQAPRAFAFATSMLDRDRPRIGVSTEASGMADTLGLLVRDVTEDGPAAKAGLKEGDRIQSINGINLRLAREDAGEEDMQGVATRRLIRALGKVKVGDEVELRVWSSGATKTLKVKTASLDELMGGQARLAGRPGDDRAAIGVSLGSGASRRDTLGVLITGIAEDGPADKAGLIEGDRIQSVNGVDLRVPAEDAGDRAMASARARRLTRELEKLQPGDEVELRVYSGGSVKTLRLKTVKASEIGSFGFFFGDSPGALRVFPQSRIQPRVWIGPEVIQNMRRLGDIAMPALPEIEAHILPEMHGHLIQEIEGHVLPGIERHMLPKLEGEILPEIQRSIVPLLERMPKVAPAASHKRIRGMVIL